MGAMPKPTRMPAPSLGDLTRRLEAVEKKLRAKGHPGIAGDERYWLLERLAREAKPGGVAYGGAVDLPNGEHYIWQREAKAGDLYAFDWTSVGHVLAALAHPVRLAILKALLEGRRSTAELQRIEGLGTTGQLYHHLKSLERGGWIRSLERGVYGVPGERVVPLLAILSACLG
jgi:DNA-binding HxlR family transcriptional regulator